MKLSKILLVLIVCSIPPINGLVRPGFVPLNYAAYSKTINYIVKKTLGDSSILKEKALDDSGILKKITVAVIAAIVMIGDEFTNTDVAVKIKRVATVHNINLDNEANIVKDYLEDYAWENYPAKGKYWASSRCGYRGGFTVTDDGKNLVLSACGSSINLNKCIRRCGGIDIELKLFVSEGGTLKCPDECLPGKFSWLHH